MDKLLLTGALCNSPQVCSLIHSHTERCELGGGFFPHTGDMRLCVHIDPAVWKLPEGPGRCRGECVLSIYDGCVWRPFDITTVITCTKFISADQLRAIERWLRHTLAVNAGRASAWKLHNDSEAEHVRKGLAAGSYCMPAPIPAPKQPSQLSASGE